jgi:SAM-dependent methyltransferase
MTLIGIAPPWQPQPRPQPRPRPPGQPWPVEPAAWTTSGPYARAITEPGSRLVLETDDGERLVLDSGRFSAAPDAVDLSVLDRCQGPTLDLGCGPGRLVAALAARGIPALGVDVAPAAVLLGRAAGAAVLQRSVFDRLPGAGRWPHALLMDGNIGIGGDPAALLDRLRTVLLPGLGELVVETDTEDVDKSYRVRFADEAGRSAGSAGGNSDNGASSSTVTPAGSSDLEFGWARMGTRALIEVASALGYTTRAAWNVGGRRFVALVLAE